MEDRYYLNGHSMKIMDNLTGTVVIEDIWKEPDFQAKNHNVTVVLECTDNYVDHLNEEYTVYDNELHAYLMGIEDWETDFTDGYIDEETIRVHKQWTKTITRIPVVWEVIATMLMIMITF